jgi:hypothetical protein
VLGGNENGLHAHIPHVRGQAAANAPGRILIRAIVPRRRLFDKLLSRISALVT